MSILIFVLIVSIGLTNIVFIIYTIARLFFKLVWGIPHPIDVEYEIEKGD